MADDRRKDGRHGPRRAVRGGAAGDARRRSGGAGSGRCAGRAGCCGSGNAAPRRGGMFRHPPSWIAALGGWGGLGGVTAAGIVGLAVGFWSPDTGGRPERRAALVAVGRRVQPGPFGTGTGERRCLTHPRPSAPARPEKRRTGRGIKIALAVSLALNLLVAGLVGGAVLSRPDPGEAPAIRTLGLGPFALALPREARDDIRRRIEDRHGRRAAQPGGGRAQSLAVRQALLAEPFDSEAAARALGRSREAAMLLQAQGHGALIETLEGMSAAERAVVADRLERALRRLARREPEDGDR
jgi:uncharacterized membrane protein